MSDQALRAVDAMRRAGDVRLVKYMPDPALSRRASELAKRRIGLAAARRA